MKISKILNYTPVILGVSVVPILTAISCSREQKVDYKWKNNPFVNITNVNSNNKFYSGLAKLEQGLVANNVNKVNANWGMPRKSDLLRAEGEIAMVERQKSGIPITEGLAPQETWNWAIDGEDENFDASKATGNGIAFKDRTSENSRFDYKKNNFTPLDNSIGFDHNQQIKDYNFDRATVREVQPRIMAPRLKDTQGDFARFEDMSPKPKTGTRIGFNKGIGNNSITTATASLPYTSSRPTWIPVGVNVWYAQAPTGNEINIFHNAGIPVQGIIFLYNGQNDYFGNYMQDPGPDGDYPVAKGLAEMANFYGFDGWWVDQEYFNMQQDKFSKFINALQSYSKKDNYTITEGVNTGKTVELSKWYKKQRAKYHYGPLTKNQLISVYSGDANFNSDIDTYLPYQKHGQDADVYSNIDQLSNAFFNEKDRFYISGAANWPEDGYSGSLKIFGKHYEGSFNFPYSDDIQNQKSVWFWSHEDNNINSDETLFSSYNGDPRITDDISTWAIGNSFRERTSIIGRKQWSTNFGIGRGKRFSLFGGKNVSEYIVNSSKDGWVNSLFIDQLPTYRWIVDTYNSNGTKIPLTLDPSTHKLVGRNVVPKINITSKNPYMGGNSLDFTGKLNPGNYIVSKLYASYIPIEKNDKFKIIIKDNWKDNNSDLILPEFSAWVNDDTYKDFKNERDYFKYKSDGTEEDPLLDKQDIIEQIAFLKTSKLGWGAGKTNPWEKRANILDYDKDIAPKWNKTTRKDFSPTIQKLDGDWLELSYDLSSLNGKTMWGYGMKVTNNSTNFENIKKLSIGEMQYIPHEYKKRTDISFANITTTKVWNNENYFYQKARIKWDLKIDDKKPWSNWKVQEDALAYLKKYYVFYLDKNGNKTQLAWVGHTPTAYLDFIDKSKTMQDIEIVAIDNMNNIIQDVRVTMPLISKGGN